MLDDFVCQIKVKPVKEWVQEQDPDICHSCLMKPLASYYMGILKEANAEAQAQKLEEAWNTEDVLTIARTMDIIKDEVREDLKKDLIAIDCFTQNYKEAEEE